MGTQQAIELLEAIGRLTIPPQDHPLEYTLATVEKTTEIAGHLLGRRVLVRTRISGVSIGVLDAVEIGASTAVVLSDAVRIWSWSGAYTVSELATNGGVCRVAHHPDSILITDSGTEILPVTDTAWAAIRDRWTVGAQ